MLIRKSACTEHALKVQLAEYNPLHSARWECWAKEDVTVGDRVFKNWVKKSKSGTVENLVEQFRLELNPSVAINSTGCIRQKNLRK